MKISNPLKTLLLLMAVLIFNNPFVTFAQRDPVPAEARTAAAQDALSDVNQLLWFTAGLGVFAIGGTIGAVAGYQFGSMAGSQEEAGVLFFDSSDYNSVLGAGLGWSVGVLAPLIFIRASDANLPPDRFIGKSPEYIDAYTEAYKKEVKNLRTKSAVGGCATGCLLGTLVAGIAAIF